MHLRFVGIVALTLPFAPLVAQQPDNVPRDLAVALARASAFADSNAGVQFTVGAVPSSVRSYAVLPGDVHVIGAVAVGRTTSVLGTSPLAPDSVLMAIATGYGKAGFGFLGTMRSTAAGGGFRAALPRFSTQFCKDSTEINTSAARSPDGLTDVRLRITQPSVTCSRIPSGPRQPASVPFGASPTSPYPLVVDPQGASFQSECYSAALSSTGTSTRLLTSMEPATLMQHYGAQLETQGWTKVSPTAPAVIGFWTRRDSSGATQIATLRVQIMPGVPTCREAFMDITTSRSR